MEVKEDQPIGRISILERWKMDGEMGYKEHHFICDNLVMPEKRLDW